MNDAYRQALARGERDGARFRLAPSYRPPAGAAGPRLGARTGTSLEFHDHRAYQPGDDLRSLDWSVFARTDRLVVKRYQEEVFPHLDLLLDGSRSMALPGSAKAEAALFLAALLAAAAANAGFSSSVTLTKEGCESVRNGSRSPSAWDELAFESRSSPADALSNRPPRWKPRGVRVLVSDLLYPGEPERIVAMLARGAAAVHVVQVLDARDVAPGDRGPVRYLDSETDEALDVLFDDESEHRFGDALRRHQEGWSAAVRRAGARLTTVTAGQKDPAESLLAAELLAPL